MARLALENIPGERAVLGAAMRDPNIFWEHKARFRPEIFVGPLHRRIVTVMHRLAEAGREIVTPSILSFLAVDEEDGVSPEGYLATLIVEEADNAVAADLLDDLSEHWARRQMARLGDRLLKESTKDSNDSAITRLEESIAEVTGIAETLESDRAGSTDAAIERMLDQVSRAHAAGRSDGIPWFIPEAGRVTGDDVEYEWLIGILADTAGGKTSFALQQAVAAAQRGVPVLFLSGDQPPEDCYRQINSQMLSIESSALRRGRISKEEFSAVHQASRDLKRLPIQIRRILRPTARQIATMVRSFKRRHGDRRALWILDHAKRVTFDDRRSGLAEGVNQVFGDLKALNLATGCAGIVLMQRNSEGDKREDSRPILPDIYGGKGAAESFDTIMAIYVEERALEQQIRLSRGRVKADRLGQMEARLNTVRGKAELIGLKTRFSQPDIGEHVIREARFTRFVSNAQPELL
ncbi:MAG: hypothetical protein KIS96_03635 [Bauldia sp.]|nr:hypothetical protein [Bauldia sp.]